MLPREVSAWLEGPSAGMVGLAMRARNKKMSYLLPSCGWGEWKEMPHLCCWMRGCGLQAHDSLFLLRRYWGRKVFSQF